MFKRILETVGLGGGQRWNVPELASFCGALTQTFADHKPENLSTNMFADVLWWSVPVYVQLTLNGPRRLADAHWQQAVDLATEGMMRRIFKDDYDLAEETQVDMEKAMVDFMAGTCELWITYFGKRPKAERFLDSDALYEEILALLRNPDLDLAARYSLAVEAEDDVEEDGEPMNDVEDMSRALAQFFPICAQSHP